MFWITACYINGFQDTFTIKSKGIIKFSNILIPLGVDGWCIVDTVEIVNVIIGCQRLPHLCAEDDYHDKLYEGEAPLL